MNMIYFSFNITNKCNKACPYCVNIDYINKLEYPDLMNFEDFKNWLEKEIKENDIVEIAGTGEPTLCEWLPELLFYLEEKKAWVMLRTNGFKLGKWRLGLSNLLVILSKHDNSDAYISDKRKYLLPYDLISLFITDKNKQGKNDAAIKFNKSLLCPSEFHNIDRAFFVTPDGKIRYMPCVKDDMGTVWDYKPEIWHCLDFSKCSFALGAHNFIEYLKAPFELLEEFDHVQAWRIT